MLSSTGDTAIPLRANSWWSNLKLWPIFRTDGSSSTSFRIAIASAVGICTGGGGASKSSWPAAAVDAPWASGM